MNVSFTENAWHDYPYWQKMDRKIIKRINELIKDIKRNPFDGLGKPEPLKYDLAGKWLGINLFMQMDMQMKSLKKRMIH